MNITKIEKSALGWRVTVEKDGKEKLYGELGFKFDDLFEFLKGYCEGKLK